jgi:AcrR family transcriptional regulator
VPRPRVHDDELRNRLLAEAGRTVHGAGIGSLSLRSLAGQVGTSTSAVYSLFGGKSELLGALYEEAFAQFGAAQRAVPVTGDLSADLGALGRAYWTWARAHPDLYPVLFSKALGDVEPTPAQAAAAAATIEPLSRLVQSAVETRQMVGDPGAITFAIWAAVHGAVSLVLANCAPDDEQTRSDWFDATAGAVIRGWLETGS